MALVAEGGLSAWSDTESIFEVEDAREYEQVDRDARIDRENPHPPRTLSLKNTYVKPLGRSLRRKGKAAYDGGGCA